MNIFPKAQRPFMLATLFVASSLGSGCATRNYTYYLVDPPQKQNKALLEDETLQRPFIFGSNTVMKVRWNDGDVLTEVDVPMIDSGQRIVVEHSNQDGRVKVTPATTLVAPPPTPADTSLIEAYSARGLRIDEGAPDISIARASSNMQEAIKAGNSQLALEWAEMVLQRYPSHPRFLRAKASLLLMMGEKEKAIQVYEQAEAVQSNAAVRKKLDELQSETP